MSNQSNSKNQLQKTRPHKVLVALVSSIAAVVVAAVAVVARTLVDVVSAQLDYQPRAVEPGCRSARALVRLDRCLQKHRVHYSVR